MAALVAAAGSPEAALMALWREKQSTANHNAQLWRLVEKQRSMVIGLQKDLERALKDKDRYRRKLREVNEQAPPVPGALQRSDTLASTADRDESQSPALSERPHDAGRSADVKTSPLAQRHASDALPDAQLAPSPSHSEAHTTSNPSSSVNSPTDYSVQPLHVGTKGLGLETVLHDSRSEPQPRAEDAPRLRTTPPPRSENQLQPPQLSVTQATPVIGGNGFESPPRKTTQPLRKPPPAPLNLSKPIATSAHLHQSTRDEDDSDYDDTLEVDEIPIIEQRGRRKTREDDDRVREALAMQEDQARSKSKKKKSESKGKQAPAAAELESLSQAQIAAGPASPRQFNPLAAGLPLSPRHPPASSLNAMLSPTNSDSSMLANRSVGSYGSPLMSPGLPSSPRPTDRPLGSPLPRNPKQSVASPPMSPSAMIHPAARTLQQPGPLPPNTPQSYQSLPAAQPTTVPSSSLLAVPGAQPSPDSNSSSPTLNEVPDAEHVYRGLVSDQYPGLLLPPNALPSIEVKVFSSRLRPSRLSFLAPKPQDEDPVFILAIYSRSDNKQLWRVEKTIATLPTLDAQLRNLCDLQAKLPDRGLFGGHAPAKIDARRVALNQYFDTILETPMSEKAAILVCEYISADVIGAQSGDRLNPEPTLAPLEPAPKTRQRKEGYLTKRGKNFGGWKARYFVLDGPEFRYYEVEGGAHLGTIKLQNAQIGKQSQQQSNQSPQRRDESEDNQYRHAFLILEPKRKDSSSLVRHVLCAENDEERDAWVDALLQHVDWPEDSSPVEVPAPATSRLQKPLPSQDSGRSSRKDSPDVETQDRLQGLSYDDTVAAEAPVRGTHHREAMKSKPGRGSPVSSTFAQDSSGHYPAISGPSNGAPIKDVEFWGNKSTGGQTTVKDKKRSIFGFRGRGGSSDLAPVQISSQQSLSQPEIRAPPPNRSIFGIPLQEAVEYTQPIGVNLPLPAVVYRCLEYLQDKKAINEEGIFRLSGSNIVIKGLRERFNLEGDIKLLDGQYYDVHAVASLLKLYLRELPASILTRELHLDFLKVLDMDERSKKIQTFNVLVHKLPQANFELLRHLSSFLIEIVDNSAVNKMTVRNVGIVFAPTLNIPAPLISFFLTDFSDIFGTALDEASSPIHELRAPQSHLSDDAIRSPRRQMFSDLPTPAFHQTSFHQQQQNHYDRQPQQYQPLAAPNYPPPQPPQGQNSNYASGFIPMRPSYDTPSYDQPYQGGEGYGSLNGATQSGNAREQRQRRRESGMLLMNMGQRNARDPRGNPLMVREETAFD
ncbi:RhoGAP-domain-containing protein [Phaeosphaeriaceae sp. SRC1lsM3a]|nr:RhoGAP-domain-containing protein [Stagonospora sp. SRC1lsM3a]